MFYISTLLHFVFRILSASLGLSLIHRLCTGCSAPTAHVLGLVTELFI